MKLLPDFIQKQFARSAARAAGAKAASGASAQSAGAPTGRAGAAPRLAGYDTKAKSGQRPVFSSVRPGYARATPRRYDRLAEEGYAQNVIVMRAVNLVARSVASIPMVLNRGDVRLSEHPLLKLLEQPNPYLKHSGFKSHFVSHYLLAGNAYMVAVGPDYSAPKELWLLRPDCISVLEGTDGLPHAYQMRDGNKVSHFSKDKVLHWKTFNPLSHWYGQAPLEAAALAVDAHNEGSRWNLALIQNGGTPSGVLYQDGMQEPLSDQQYDTLKQSVEEHYTGPQNAGRPMLLEGGLRWQEMGLSPKDMDWIQAKNMSAREIALAFGVPSQMLGIPDAQTYSNYAEARLSLWEDTVIPVAQELVNELNCWLVPQFGDGLSLALDLDDVPALEPKRQRRFERIGAATFLSDDEKRSLLGFERKLGKQADMSTVQDMLRTLEQERRADEASAQLRQTSPESEEDREASMQPQDKGSASGKAPNKINNSKTSKARSAPRPRRPRV